MNTELWLSSGCFCLVAQSCLILCNPRDCSPRGSSVHGILQARILEWVAISFFRVSSWPRDGTQGLLHCRRTLHHLHHQGSPKTEKEKKKKKKPKIKSHLDKSYFSTYIGLFFCREMGQHVRNILSVYSRINPISKHTVAGGGSVSHCYRKCGNHHWCWIEIQDNLTVRTSQLQPYWYFGSDNPSLWGLSCTL